MKVLKINSNYKHNNDVNCKSSSINYKCQQFNPKNIKTSDDVCFTGNSIKPHKIGETIEHLGLVIKELKVHNYDMHRDEECYLFFKRSQNGGSFCLMRKIPEKLKELSDELKKYPDTLSEMQKAGCTIFTPALKAAKEVAPQLVELFNELTIAEITYAKLNGAQNFEKVTKFGYKPINSEDGITTIQNLFLNQKKYKQATIAVVAPLFRALTQGKIKRNVIVKASAYGENRVSPFNLYSRYGFKPLSATTEEIETHKIPTSKGLRVNPDYPVLMYLPEDALLYKISRDKSNLDEINKISPGWFNLDN